MFLDLVDFTKQIILSVWLSLGPVVLDLVDFTKQIILSFWLSLGLRVKSN